MHSQDKATVLTDMRPEIDILMAVHAGTDPVKLDKCLKSLFAQVGVVLRLIIVFDGQVSTDVSKLVEESKKLVDIIILRQATNKGLAKSLNFGLCHVRSDYFLRVDDDDIQLPERALTQLVFMQKNLHLAASSTKVTLVDEIGQKVGMRSVPTDPARIRAFAKYRSPLNHPSAIIKTAALRAVGGYPEFRKGQDYALWCKFLVSGYELGNQEIPLVKMYVGHQLWTNRGWSFLKRELEAVRYAHVLGFTSRYELFLSILFRILKRGTAECMQLLYRR